MSLFPTRKWPFPHNLSSILFHNRLLSTTPSRLQAQGPKEATVLDDVQIENGEPESKLPPRKKPGRLVMETINKHGPMTTQTLYNVCLSVPARPVLPSRGGGSSILLNPKTPIPHLDHPIRSITYLKHRILPTLEFNRQLKKITVQQLSKLYREAHGIELASGTIEQELEERKRKNEELRGGGPKDGSNSPTPKRKSGAKRWADTPEDLWVWIRGEDFAKWSTMKGLRKGQEKSQESGKKPKNKNVRPPTAYHEPVPVPGSTVSPTSPPPS